MTPALTLKPEESAGVTLADYLLKHPEIKHGPIQLTRCPLRLPRRPLRLCFTPDEEVNHGVDHLDLDELGANVAYTLDGGDAGEVGWETFSADEAVVTPALRLRLSRRPLSRRPLSLKPEGSAGVTIEGVSTHPGEGRKYGMVTPALTLKPEESAGVNAVHLAAKLLAALPREAVAPETTEKRQGYLHPDQISGNVARAEIHFILRDHALEGLADKGTRLKGLCRGLQAAEPRCRITPQYCNMGYWLKDDMTPVNLAYAAVRAIGLEPVSRAARGGTDGSRLTERGLPTPNLFCGGHPRALYWFANVSAGVTTRMARWSGSPCRTWNWP